MQPLRSLSPRRLLVVDDDDAILALLTTRLVIAGYKVTTARQGFEAIRNLRDLRPDAMILDLNMPVLDGFGVLERMRQSSIKPPTLVLTARHCAQDVEKAIRLGAKDYLAKPFEDRALLGRVARLFRTVPAAAPQAVPPTGPDCKAVEI
jgi:two-component system OmpR family response regulator